MDLELAKKEFIKYTNSYDITNSRIKRKVDHSLRVMNHCKTIAKSLSLSKEEIDLAILIGLLHDIARFEQVTIYNTFNDRESFDHGDYGEEILKKDNYIRKFIKDCMYDKIIFSAIRNHNKYKIEAGLSEKEQLFAKIIRDADKIDILYQGTCITWANSEEIVENGTIIKENIQPFIEKRMINRNKDLEKVENPMAHLLTIFGFIFDFNFKSSFKILKETDYMNKILDRFNFKDVETKELLEEVRKIVNTHIEAKLKG